MSRMFSWEITDVALICLCYIEQATPAQIRYAIRRIRRRSPDVLILVALFGNTEPIEGEEDSGTEFIQQSLREAVAKIIAVANNDAEPQPGLRSPSPPSSPFALLLLRSKAPAPRGIICPNYLLGEQFRTVLNLNVVYVRE